MNIQKVLRTIIVSGIFILPFIALIVSSSLFFPFITGKNFTFRIIVEIITASWILLALINSEYRPRKNTLIVSVVAFVVVIFFADLFGKYPYKSFWSNYERMEGFITIAHLFVYFLVAISVLNKRLWERLFQTNLFVSFIIAMYGFCQLSGSSSCPIHQGGTRLDASLGNATYLGIYMLFNIFFALVFISRKKGLTSRIVYGTLTFLNVIILYNTATRGSLLGLIGGLGLAALLVSILERKNKGVRNVALGTVAAFVIVIGLFFALKNTDFVKKSSVLSRFSSISLTERTTQSRFLIWNMAWKGFKESPKTIIIGWGQENFNYVFNKYYLPEMYNQEPWFDRTHNVVLDWLIAGGLLGFLSYMSLIVSAIYLLWRKTENSLLSLTDKALLTGLFVAYFVHNLFVFDNLTSYILFFTVLGYVYTTTIHSQNLKKMRINSEKPAWILSTKNTNIALPVVGVILVAVIYFLNVPAILANTNLISAITPADISVPVRFDYYKKAISYNSFGSPEAREQLETAYANIVHENLPPDVQEKLTSYIQSQMEEQIKRTPDDARYELFAGSFFSATGKFKEALPHYKRSQALSPNKQQITFELAATYINLKQYDLALQILKKTFEQTPEYQEARFFYTIGAIYAGKNELADELQKGLTPSYLSDQRFANAYLATKQYSKLRYFFEQKVKEIPDNVDLRISLAATYLQIGERQLAIQQLEEVSKIKPDFKPTADAYIEQIKEGKTPGQ